MRFHSFEDELPKQEQGFVIGSGSMEEGWVSGKPAKEFMPQLPKRVQEKITDYLERHPEIDTNKECFDAYEAMLVLIGQFLYLYDINFWRVAIHEVYIHCSLDYKKTTPAWLQEQNRLFYETRGRDIK